MLRLVHPAPQGKDSAHPRFRRILSQEESRRVRVEMKNLCRAYGGWDVIAAMTGYAENSLRHVAYNPRELVSPSMALAIATIGGVPFEQLISGRPHEVGTCPFCGRKGAR